MIMTKKGLTDLLAGAIQAAAGAAGLLNGCTVLLFVNNLAINEDTVLADLVEATWPGYARSTACVWGAPIISNETLLPATVSDPKTFVVTTNAGNERIYGFGLVHEAAPDHLIAVELLEEPFIPAAATQLTIQPRLGLPPETQDPSGDVTFV